MSTYRITLTCSGVPAELGPGAAADVAEEFTHRPWHTDVVCTWDGARLVLTAANDFDETGDALLDEFSDAVCACTPEDVGVSFELQSVAVVGDGDARTAPHDAEGGNGGPAALAGG